VSPSTNGAAYDSFESFCTRVLSDLGLGFPVHLAVGSDRGKDILLNTTVGNSPTAFAINVECKFHSRPIGPTHLFSKDLWARADKVDMLLIMTNNRLTAGAADWLRQTASQRGFPVITWTGEYLQWLESRLSTETPESEARKELVASVQRQLREHIESHRRLVDSSPDFDPELLVYQEPDLSILSEIFVDREKEVLLLSRLEDYRVAIITAPIGMGKTTLAYQILRIAKERGYTPLPLRLSGEDVTQEGIFLKLGQALSKGGKHTILKALATYGRKNLYALLPTLMSAIRRGHYAILLDDFHALDDSSPLVSLVSELALNAGNSRMVITSRTEPVWMPSLLASSIHLTLGGFDSFAVTEYFNARRLICPRALVNKLAKRHMGWPIVVAAVGSSLASGSSEADISHILRSEKLEIALAASLLARTTDVDKRLLSFLVTLKVAMNRQDLVVVSDLSLRQVATSWNNLVSYGLLQPLTQPPKCIHEFLRSALVQLLPELPEVERALGLFLRSRTANATWIIAAAEHFASIDDHEEAARTMALGAEAVIRNGLYEQLLAVLARIRPEGTPEELRLRMALLQSQAFEAQGQLSQALNVLMVQFYPETTQRLNGDLGGHYHYSLAHIYYLLGDYSATRTHLEYASSVAQTCTASRNSFLLRAQVLSLMARLEFVNRRLSEAEALYLKALDLCVQIEDLAGINKIHYRLALIMVRRGDITNARREFLRVAEKCKALNDVKRLSYALHRIGQVERQMGDNNSAKKYFRQSLKIKKRIGHRRGLVYTTLELADLEINEGNLDSAENYIETALKILDLLEMPKEKALAFRQLGRLRFAERRIQEGEACMKKAALLFEGLGLDNRVSATAAELKRFLEELDVN
jgi:ATP/maltotriose-dependent transcriptional regulator MalT